MNTTSRLHSKSLGFFGKLFYTSLVVCGLGITSAPAQAAVTVDQSPLIVQASLPPNIVLMLDDSGSMANDYMPDSGYLPSDIAGTTQNPASYQNSSNNGTYYNPSITYSAPPKANGTDFYPASPDVISAYRDGFLDTTTTDVTKYTGSYSYYTGFTVSVTNTYDASSYISYSCPNGYSIYQTTKCRKNSDHSIVKDATATTIYYCNSGDSLSGTTCTNVSNVNKYYFTYTTGNATGPYTSHYVGAAGDCAYLSATYKAVCDDSPTVRQNVANWFSYYRTRMLMAKSGLMNSFASIDPKYRVGFGSINGNNDDGLPASKAQYGSNNNYIAKVSPFGDGSAGTQKASFWSWVNGETPNNSTPLRRSLDAVGQYYQSSQPWSTMSTDPDPTGNANTELACRQSYTILTTDGFWNGGTPSSVGDTDGSTGATVTGPNSQSYTYSPVLPYTDSKITTTTTTYDACSQYGSNYYLVSSGSGAPYCRKSSSSTHKSVCSSGDTYDSSTQKCTSVTTSGTSTSDTLADVAMKYWETDLRSSTANEVPTSTEDPAFWQHMTTFTLGLGFTPVYSDQTTTIPVQTIFDWANGDASKAISNFAWPTPASNSLNNIADLAHAAVNGHGGFYSATSPETFANGLKDALKRASERVGTGASLAANSTQLDTGTVAFQANYYTAKWKGDLKALSVDSSTGAIATTPSWTASQKMPAASARNIYTYNPSAGTYLAFKLGTGNALPALSTAQNTALSSVSGTATTEASLINFLRGDASTEQATSGGTYRNRETPLGDIIDSQPIYVGSPDPNQFYSQSFSGTSSFAQYASDKAGRTALIYVASNDGLMHAFNASTGVETYAYLPGAVITSGLSALADPEYGAGVDHAYFNDGELTVADVYVSGAWKTVLVGTTGRGLAKAVYALDITDPANIAFLWERSASDGKTNSNYIGQMTGKPVVAQTANGTWSVLMGNGYNSAAAKAALLQFELADGTLHVHQTTDTSGLAAPAVWEDPSGNGVSTIAYAGDADGNVWSFGLNTSTDNPDTPTPDSAGTKLFTAKDSSNNPQPITAGMLAGKDAQTGNVWVFFGTGKYLASGDLSDTSTQTWYGLVVQSASTSNPAVTSTMTRSANLASRAITAETAASGNTLASRTITTATAASALTNKSGWYIDLLSPTGTSGAQVQQGERMVTSNQFQGNLLLGTTRIPQASDACNPSGRGWILAVDPFTGTNPAVNFFDANGDGVINSSDGISGTPSAGVGFGSLPNNPIFVGGSMLTSFDNGSTSSLKTSSSTGGLKRVSWRELINQ